MLTKKSFIALIIIALSFGFYSCSDDKKNDAKGPNIELFIPQNEAVVARGNPIIIDAELSDESGLGSYKIDIHWAGDGHSHKSAKARSTTHDDHKEWSYVFVSEDLKGAENIHINHTTDVIPENAESGHYHLGILAIDVYGNESKKYIEIEVE